MKHSLNVDMNGYFADRLTTPLSPEAKWKSALRQVAQACFAQEITEVNADAPRSFANYFQTTSRSTRS